MMLLTEKEVAKIRAKYHEGMRIRLNAMDDPYSPILPGTEGNIVKIDDQGQLHMKWDNGRTLALIPDVDSFSVIG